MKIHSGLRSGLATIGLLLPGNLLAAPPSLRPAVERQVILAVESEMARQQMPGAIVAIQRDRHAPWIISRGVANLLSRKRMLTTEHMRIGSVTKAFVTTLLLRLAQEGKLSLDDPISRYVAGVPNGNHITLRQLANMTAGLADYFSNDDFSFDYLTGETFSPQRLLDLGLAKPPLFPPGTAWSYSNTNTTLLGMTIEKVTGQPLGLVLRDKVFRPLGLRGTSLPSLRTLRRPFANGYTVQTVNHRLGEATFATPTSTWAAGGIVSTASDLLRAARLFGTGEPLLNKASQLERQQWVKFPPNSPIQQYGIGVFSFNGWIGHNGGIPGYTAIAWYLPQQRMSLVVMVNSDIHIGKKRANYAYEPASEIGHEITRIISPGHIAPLAVKVRGSRVTGTN